MTLALLTLILLSYTKLTGKSLPRLEKNLNRIKNSKKNNTITEFGEREFNKLEAPSFKRTYYNPTNKTKLFSQNVFSGSLRI